MGEPIATRATWKTRLEGRIPEALEREISVFETQMALRRQGKLDEKIFAELRLRRGAYGQRYDNGQRHDGQETRRLNYPCGDITKGPDTVWDAPGMMRIKIPMGKVTPEQLDRLAEVAEDYADAILHVTTRQDIQLHFVHLDDTPALMRRLGEVGITTREACGNSVRNITACPKAGVCGDEGFDVTPYADAMTWYLLGHRDVQDFGRKLKIAFSGCKQHACGLAKFHCIGLVANGPADADGVRSFEFVVGGGLGAVPKQAKVMEARCTEEELLPLTQAVCRVFARLGQKKNRARARLKFLVDKVGVAEFARLVAVERKSIPEDERWTRYLEDLDKATERPLKAGRALAEGAYGAAFEAWRRSNVEPQRQQGYVVATVRMPLGDFTAAQARALADLGRRWNGGHVRLTVEQNLVFRWISEADLPAFYEGLAAIGLHRSGAGTLRDITSCPGTDTCKLGVSASRGLAAELERRLDAKAEALGEDIRGLRIKVSGCFNSCGQHHVADVGFLGVSRNVGGRRVAHFQLVVGGEWANNAGSYGLAIGAYPSKRIPDVVDRLVALYREHRRGDERFKEVMKRVGRRTLKEGLEDLKAVPSYEEDPSFYVDWGDSREYTIGDLGVGECAGEVVSFTEFGLAKAERENFEAQLALDEGRALVAAESSWQAMLSAAKALIQMQFSDVKGGADEGGPEEIVAEFRARFYETKLFHDAYARGKFGAYLFKWDGARPGAASDAAEARQRIEEAQLFIEAAHGCHQRMAEQAAGAQAAGEQAASKPFGF